MGDQPPSNIPRFRIVAGRQLGERSSSGTTMHPSMAHDRISQVSNVSHGGAGMSMPQMTSSPQPQGMYSQQQAPHHQMHHNTPMQQQVPHSSHQPLHQQQQHVTHKVQHVVHHSPHQMGHAAPMNSHHAPYPTQMQPQQPPHPVSMSQSPQVYGGAPVVSHAQPPVQATTSSDDQSGASKCVRFFKALLNPDQQNRVEVRQVVKELVESIIFGNMSIEEFTTKLQDTLKSQAQPHLLPFLKNTLPQIRTAIRNGDVVIEGISPPANWGGQHVVQAPPHAMQQQSMQQHPPQHLQQPMHQQMSQPMHQIQQQLPPQQTHSVQQQQQSQQPHQQQHQQQHQPQLQPQHQQPHQQQSHQQSHQQQHQPQPQHLKQEYQPQPQHLKQEYQPQQHQPKQEYQPPQLQSQPQQVSAPQPPQQSYNQVPVQSFPVEDEPPPQQIPSEEDVIQVRKYEQNALANILIRPEDVMRRITKRMNEACLVEADVLSLVSDALEYRLRELLAELAILAEHRLDPLKTNPNYVAVDDTRKQLRFLEEVDKEQEKQREHREKEAVIRMSKSKGSNKDTIELAKQMQRADAEEKRNRDANAAAIAALSSNKTIRQKWDQLGSGSTTVARPRTVRVNIRDAQALFVRDKHCARSRLIHKLTLCGAVSTETT